MGLLLTRSTTTSRSSWAQVVPLLFLLSAAALVLQLADANSSCGELNPRNNPFNCTGMWSNMVEVYEEQGIAGDQDKKKYCCPPDIQASEETTCMLTPCWPEWLVGARENMCPDRTTRGGGGKSSKLEQVGRHPCVYNADGSGKPGFRAECCPANSFEGYLQSALGAELNEFPHLVTFALGGSIGGGTVYNKRFIITAGHVVVNTDAGETSDPAGIKAHVGTNIKSVFVDDASGPAPYRVKRIIPHPDYTGLKNSSWFHKRDGNPMHDIALVEVDRDIEFGERVKALPIAPKGFRPLSHADSAMLAGWGLTDFKESPLTLQKTNLKIRPDDECFSQYWTGSADNRDGILCLGGIWNGVWGSTPGSGDSGGPAVCRGEDGSALLCGVVSFGMPVPKCMDEHSAATCPPGMFVEVEHYHDWILATAGEQDPASLFKHKLYGEEVPAGKYEHQVHITSSNGKSCGGTLISKSAVLTAAQCVLDSEGKLHWDLKVAAFPSGEVPLASGGKSFDTRVEYAVVDGFDKVGVEAPIGGEGGGSGGRSRRSIAGYEAPSKRTEHGYSRTIMTDLYHKHDLAIIFLKGGEVDIEQSKLPELPQSDSSDPTGLATEISFPRNTTYGSTLMQREFKFVPRGECQGRLNRLSYIGAGMSLDDDLLCAVETYSGGSRCDRELGGGLICKGERGQDVLCGVQTFRLCEFAIPNGFVNVAKHKVWIESMKGYKF